MIRRSKKRSKKKKGKKRKALGVSISTPGLKMMTKLQRPMTTPRSPGILASQTSAARTRATGAVSGNHAHDRMDVSKARRLRRNLHATNAFGGSGRGSSQGSVSESSFGRQLQRQLSAASRGSSQGFEDASIKLKPSSYSMLSKEDVQKLIPNKRRGGDIPRDGAIISRIATSKSALNRPYGPYSKYVHAATHGGNQLALGVRKTQTELMFQLLNKVRHIPVHSSYLLLYFLVPIVSAGLSVFAYLARIGSSVLYIFGSFVV